MEQDFKLNPILNSPYHKPEKHWKLDGKGVPVGGTVSERRNSKYIVPVPLPKNKSEAMEFDYQETENHTINDIRRQVDKWRNLTEDKQGVTYPTRRLLEHWREGQTEPRLFFCQIEAAETFIWLNEVAPNTTQGKRILDELKNANEATNSSLLRYAAKMATGSGKTMVMAMLIAYHTINKSRMHNSPRFSNNFLIVTPGITIKDRLRVLLPSDPNAIYREHNLVPSDLEEEIKIARILITNYHAFNKREKTKLTTTARDIFTGNNDEKYSTKENEGEMLARACKELIRSKNVIVINDEAHHCYRHKESGKNKVRISQEDKQEAKKNNEAAHVWISGIEALGRQININCVYDLSATPFFLRGSGHKEGELFPWVVSDFALMDAIESGIVKVPRVPVKDNARTDDGAPMYRDLYKSIRQDLPKKSSTKNVKQSSVRSDRLPTQLRGAMQTLYGHYKKIHKSWKDRGIEVPPVFIIVCNNTATSKLIYENISGYEVEPGIWKKGSLELFNNVGEDRKLSSEMHTLLIDSAQLDSGEAMSDEFKKAAASEIQIFKDEIRKRSPEKDTENLTDEELLREVMNTVGKKGHLGEQIRCVVSVSMLTEGWDANNVTHILGVRAFGTQLLCEQVVGRGLRRYSYELISEGENEGRLPLEISEVFGVPFAFALPAEVPPPPPPKPQYRVQAMSERANLEIVFPRVLSYTVQIPDEKLIANFDEDSRMTIAPEVAASVTEVETIMGPSAVFTLDDLRKHRENEVIFYLAAETAKLFSDGENRAPPSVFRDLVPIVRHWIRDYLTRIGDVPMQYLLWQELAEEAGQRIRSACTTQYEDESDRRIAIVDNFMPQGSTSRVNFLTSKKRRYETAVGKCHINYAVCDSDWEMSFCKFLEGDSGVHAYVRNDRLDFRVPYTYQGKSRHYEPDYIVLVDDGKGKNDLLRLVVEVKGERGNQARAKANTMKRYWLPSVNNDGRWGRWAFVEIDDMKSARERLAQFTVRHKTAQTVE